MGRRRRTRQAGLGLDRRRFRDSLAPRRARGTQRRTHIFSFNSLRFRKRLLQCILTLVLGRLRHALEQAASYVARGPILLEHVLARLRFAEHLGALSYLAQAGVQVLLVGVVVACADGLA